MKQTVSKLEKKKDRREGQGRVISLSRHVYRLQGKDTFYVESESCDSRYYFVRYNPSVFEWCSCKDYESNRSEKCKHIHAVEFGIRFNTIQEVEKLPEEIHKVKRDLVAEKYKNYSIKTLNDMEKAEIEAEEYRSRRVLSYEDEEYSF